MDRRDDCSISPVDGGALSFADGTGNRLAIDRDDIGVGFEAEVEEDVLVVNFNLLLSDDLC